MFLKVFILACLPVIFCGEIVAQSITDVHGELLQPGAPVGHVICSGPGCLRLLTYLQAQDRIAGVDDIETRHKILDARPYALANPQFKQLPVFGEFRGKDNPEQILNLVPQPDLIFKTFPLMGHNPVELQEKTGIPVVALDYGDLGKNCSQLYETLRQMGSLLGKDRRAQEVITFFEETIADLRQRTASIDADHRPSAYIGGVAARGPHGFQSTEPQYPPFTFINARNLAFDEFAVKRGLSGSNISKEKIIVWDPDYLFLDLATLQLEGAGGGLHELKTDPAYQLLTAVKKKRVYGLLPYNLYAANYGSILANAYFLGKLIYPDRFEDIEPTEKADEIYSFLVGKPVFAEMSSLFMNLVFQPIQLTE
ncbi:iron ABC transporter substrate-binding protein [Desulforhopalus sp. IMCC35007]|uniref:iron ABC transporter substrate-binding protein n=1 Tax=Desulforhopalus sp. IMCC35007 TaxID=2569543 RepID=UPI0010AED38B|nr:iron ABC transporter substrate-binding protein [Desulforhopalus sp. IMCC35007]TKB06141.1 iron ABC transporter substrate-binding protein [Desulforhopalus sp. IMCC35007]